MLLSTLFSKFYSWPELVNEEEKEQADVDYQYSILILTDADEFIEYEEDQEEEVVGEKAGLNNGEKGGLTECWLLIESSDLTLYDCDCVYDIYEWDQLYDYQLEFVLLLECDVVVDWCKLLCGDGLGLRYGLGVGDGERICVYSCSDTDMGMLLMLLGMLLLMLFKLKLLLLLIEWIIIVSYQMGEL
ncbi:MAG: hypothetical protein EZS28_044432 [Streblomastix strix]|uniref:Uncharacterized protein n=1 Tax=Streblomastix strix TaxID=222440 RepID=A0A5J4TRF8_9EUKA|nr:MAG: hypothetical protein EZS28_044432 [Streblomastix strix]